MLAGDLADSVAQVSAVQCGPYDYTRSGNPTRAQLEAHMADLEVRSLQSLSRPFFSSLTSAPVRWTCYAA